MKKAAVFLLLFALCAVAQNTDVAYWRVNSGAWGKQTIEHYLPSDSTLWVGPFYLWPSQAINITVVDTAGTPVDSVSFNVDLFQWYTNDTSKAVHMGTLMFASHESATTDSTIVGFGSYTAVITSQTFCPNYFLWLRCRMSEDHKVRSGIFATFVSSGHNKHWVGR